MSEGSSKPLPTPSIESALYWAALAEHRLTMPKCEACGKVRFPSGSLCPDCGSPRHSWVQMSGRGRIFSYVTFHRVYDPAFADSVPYVVALVELEEGARMLSNIEGISPEDVRCDMPVEVMFDDVAERTTLPKFQPRR